MTRRAALVVLTVLCGCDRVFGLIGDDSSDKVDAQVGSDGDIDPLVDAREPCAEYFKATAPLSTVQLVRGIAAGDVDSDMRADLVAVEWTTNAPVLQTWTGQAGTGLDNDHQSQDPTVGFPDDVAIGDLVGDATKEIVTLDPSSKILRIISADGSSATAPTGNNPRSLEVANVEGGDYDTAGWVNADDAQYAEWKTPGGLPTYPMPPSPTAVAFADVKGDATLEALVVSVGETKLTIGKNRETTMAFSGRRPLVVAGGKNGSTRLVAIGFDTQNVVVFTVSGSDVTQLGVPLVLESVPTAVRLVDLDRDGVDELVVLAGHPVGSALGALHIYPAGASGAYNARVSQSIGVDPLGMAIGDFSGDGYPDIAIANNDSTVSVLQNCR